MDTCLVCKEAINIETGFVATAIGFFHDHCYNEWQDGNVTILMDGTVIRH